MHTPLKNTPIFKVVDDETAALYTAEFKEQRVIQLAGVSIHIGEHPVEGLSYVVFPALGDHLIITNPFAGQNASS
jgi:hypothetical protein